MLRTLASAVAVGTLKAATSSHLVANTSSPCKATVLRAGRAPLFRLQSESSYPNPTLPASPPYPEQKPRATLPDTCPPQPRTSLILDMAALRVRRNSHYDMTPTGTLTQVHFTAMSCERGSGPRCGLFPLRKLRQRHCSTCSPLATRNWTHSSREPRLNRHCRGSLGL